MRVLNLLTSGETGGIESLCRDIGTYSKLENAFCFVTHGGVVYEQMKSMGMTTYNLEDLGRKFSIRKLLALTIISKGYDIIVVHHGDPFLKLYFILLKILRNKKMITMVHSCYDNAHFQGYGRFKRYVCDKIFSICINISDDVIYVSEAGKRTYESRYGKLKAHSHVVYNGISIEKIEQGADNTISNNPPFNITYIGRLSKVKGIDILIRAVALVCKEVSVKLSIVGDGVEKEELEDLTRQLGIENITTFYGQQLDIVPFLASADLFVYPSTCQEVFGISIVEALAFGVPCIANAVGGIPEIITDGVTGLLCKSFDEKELAEKIKIALSSNNNEMINEGRKVANSFSILNTVKNLKQIYGDCVNL